MQVTKRDGKLEDVSFDKVLNRIKLIKNKFNLNVEPVIIAQNVCSRIYDKVLTTQLDNFTSELCISMITEHPDYEKLASYIAISNNHKNTSPSFSETIKEIYDNKNIRGDDAPLISKKLFNIIKKNKKKINSYIDYERDYLFDFFGFKTLEKSYLIKINSEIVERPQHLLMRVSLGIHGADIKAALETYDMMSNKYFIHATPTLFNAGSNRPQMSSCFLLSTEDSVNGIYKNISDCAKISKWAGGIGIHISNIRGNSSYIAGTNGYSNGIMPMLKVYNETARYIDQGGGKRKGSIAVYIEPWHSDIETFLDIRKNNGDENLRARDLFQALWIPDLFMERVKNNQSWSLFCPNEAPGLNDVYGDKFKDLYEKYESEKKYSKQLSARDLFYKVLESQIETGTPYMLYKDACNKKSNQKNLGVIKSSNLCVSGDTRILTKKGNYKIKTLCDKEVKVWNGKKWSDTIVRKTGDNQKLLNIHFSNGMDIKTTEYHKFYIKTDDSDVHIVRANELKKDMKLISYDLSTCDTSDFYLKNAYTHGLFSILGKYTNNKCSQRCKNKKKNEDIFCSRHNKNYLATYPDNTNKCCADINESKPIIILKGVKINLENNISYVKKTQHKDMNIYELKKQDYNMLMIPYTYNLKSKLKWLGGIIDGVSFIKNNKLYIPSREKKFLKNITFLLQTLGIKSKLNNSKDIYDVLKTVDNSCVVNKYNKYTIEINLCGIKKLHNLGFRPSRFNFMSYADLPDETYEDIYVTNIVDNNEYDETYCFTEPDEGKGIFNGLLTGNCAEIIEYTDKDNIAVCNLSSIAINMFYDEKMDIYDYEKLGDITRIVTRNLNKIIDKNFYPLPETKKSNMNTRPIGIGVQGFSDLLFKMRINFDSEQAREINKKIFACIYYNSAHESMLLAKKNKPYKYFKDSPASHGLLQFDLWNKEPHPDFDWKGLREDIKEYGLYNSLLTALMPTASTSQILGNYECFEAITSNIYLRRTLAGEFIIINKYLIKDLIKLNLWSKKMKNKIIKNNGSIQNIKNIPTDIKNLYKTVWEISQKVIIDLSADRGLYIDQSQSMNLFVAEPNFKKLSAMHFYAWSKGLKTGMYYLRTKPKSASQQFTIENDSDDEEEVDIEKLKLICSLENKDACQMCSG